MIKLLGDDEFQQLMTENTILELTDDSDEGKLLGITLDLIYDKKQQNKEAA